MSADTETAPRRANDRGPALEGLVRMQEIPYGYCHCGCGEKTNIIPWNDAPRGKVRGEPYRFVAGHSPRGRPQWWNPTPTYTVDEETGCWIWGGAITGEGYGMKRDPARGKQIPAHRFYYERLVGPIPDGLQLDHLCRHRACVNPEHLEPVTCTENIRRGANTKLTMEQAREIRASNERGIDLAERFGVSKSLVAHIRTNRIWKDEAASRPENETG